MSAYVPIDLHRHRSVVMHMADDGEVLGWVRIANDPDALVAEVLKAGEAPDVAIEATYGWYWAVDALEGAGANVHLVAPSKVGAFENRRVKNDQRDCRLLGEVDRQVEEQRDAIGALGDRQPDWGGDRRLSFVEDETSFEVHEAIGSGHGPHTVLIRVGTRGEAGPAIGPDQFERAVPLVGRPVEPSTRLVKIRWADSLGFPVRRARTSSLIPTTRLCHRRSRRLCGGATHR